MIFRVNDNLYLVDLPGYGYAQVSKGERARFARLIKDVLTERPRLVGVVWLLDIRRDPSDEDIVLGQRLMAHETPILVALTKTDKLSKAERKHRVALLEDSLSLPTDQIIVTSAVTKEGIDTLRDTIASVAQTR